MGSKYNKYVSLITILTIISLSLFFLDKISEILFLIIFIPLSIFMLLIGILELKKTLENDTDEAIKKHAIEIKNRKST